MKKSSVKKSSRAVVKTHHQKIAAARGKQWRAKLRIGKKMAQLNPSEVRLRRLSLELSQTDLAKKIGVSLGVLGAVERGYQSIDQFRAKKIADALKKPVLQLFKNNKKGGGFLAITREIKI